MFFVIAVYFVCFVCVLGVEFLLPTKAFYCKLCKEFMGDAACAEAHLKTTLHNNNYLVMSAVFHSLC